MTSHGEHDNITLLQWLVNWSVSQGFYNRWGQLAHLAKVAVLSSGNNDKLPISTIQIDMVHCYYHEKLCC